MNGSAPLDYSADPVQNVNVVTPPVNKEPAVTLGTGVTSQELTDALDKSGLFSFGAAACRLKARISDSRN